MNLAKRFLAFFLSLVIFISSGGVVLAVHYCSKKTTKEVSFFQHNSCCSKKSSVCKKNIPDEFLKKKCCELKISYHKVDVSSLFYKLQQLNIESKAVDNFSETKVAKEPAFLSSTFCNKAPPFYTGGKTFLYFSQLLLI